MTARPDIVLTATDECRLAQLLRAKARDGGALRGHPRLPIGGALLGLSVGDSIEWPMPSGQPRRLRVTAVHYQPEAEGNLDL